MEEEQQLDELDNAIVNEANFEKKMQLVALKKLHDEYYQLKAQQRQINRKYADIMKPLYARASQLILGSDPQPQELTNLPDFLKPDEQPSAPVGILIERYWFTAITFSKLEETAHERDERLLEYLLDIQRPQPLEQRSLTLKFIFASNGSFAPEETEFTRKLQYNSLKQLVSLSGDIPTWKIGKWPQWRIMRETDSVTLRTKVTKGAKIESFFDIFMDWNILDNPKILEKCEFIMKTLAKMVKSSYRYFLGMDLLENQVGEDDDGQGGDEMEEVNAGQNEPPQ